jgi:glycosyltransferase involved in cell wall biosynthesis
MQLSVVIPYFGCDSSLDDLCERLHVELENLQMESEVIFVFDGPEAGSWNFLQETANKFDFKCVKLVRNFGQHAATKAGLSLAKGELIITLDCDLQDPPELISKLVLEMTKDIDVVFAKRLGRYDGRARNFARVASRYFLKRIYPPKFDLDIGSFMLIRKKIARQILEIKGPDHVGLMVNWLQFPSKTILYERDLRVNGISGYSFKKLISHGMEALSFDLSHFFKIAMWASLSFSCFSLVLGFASLIRAIFFNTLSGWASIFVIVTLGFSLTITLLSLIGYVVVHNLNASRKPPFIIEERIQ